MGAIVLIFLLIMVAGYFATIYNRRRWRKRDRMFCYFEYEYNGKIGTSRDYGPMKEIDAVGAMQYRQANGAMITFEKFSNDIEEIHELIDMRQFMHNKRKERLKYNDSY